jgi:hypothetical protein
MAKAGYFLVTKELIDSEMWPKISAELSKSFWETKRIDSTNGCLELHGYCDFFEDLPEGQTKQYEAVFKGENLSEINPA